MPQIFWVSAMTGNQPCNFGCELDPLARYHGDRLDGADRDAIAAARAGRGIDDGAAPLAGEDSDRGMIANFRATPAGHAMPLDADVGSGDAGNRRPLIHARRARGIAGCDRKYGRQQCATRQRHILYGPNDPCPKNSSRRKIASLRIPGRRYCRLKIIISVRGRMSLR